MSDHNDELEFIEICEREFNEGTKQLLKKPSYAEVAGTSPGASEDEGPSQKPGTPTQFALYGSGYTATTPTIEKLPSGCYDLVADDKCVYAKPSQKPSGLLLELPEMKSAEIVSVVENFWNSEKDYKEGNEFVIGGAAFKAGLMLYGPPGSGKTSVLKLVCNKLVERSGTVFYCSNAPWIASNFLSDFSKIEPNRKCIVIFEDLDSLIYQHGESYYLEMLDSSKSIDNVLFIATTNYPEKLDPRIYNRPGRFSQVIKVGLPTPAAREAYLKAILKNHRDVKEIVAKTEGFTIDHLTACVNSVYREKKDLHKEIDRLRTLFKVPKAEEEKRIGL